MAYNWVKYNNSDNATELFNLERATRFRHIDPGSEPYVEVYADGDVHTIMSTTDPEAYRKVMDYIAQISGYQLD